MNPHATTTRPSVFAHTPWDLIPVLMGLGHLAFVAFLFFGFHATPWVDLDSARAALFDQYLVEHQLGQPQLHP